VAGRSPGEDDRRIATVVSMTALLPELPSLSEAERRVLGEWLTRSLDVMTG